MTGIDTNLLLRLLETDEHARRTAAAVRAVEEECPVFISPVVLVEFVRVLRRIFKLNRLNIHERLEGIVNSNEFIVAFPEATRRAVTLFRAGPAGFLDYLIGEMNLAQDCVVTLTFDRDAAKNPAFRHLAV